MLSNKAVCVTGTDRGIGLAITEALLHQGYTVYAGGIMGNNEELTKLGAQFPDQLHVFKLDVGSDESVKEAARYIKSRSNQLEFLINNAAILGDTVKTIEDDLDFEEIQRVYNVSALGAIRMANSLLEPIMNGGKLIVNISSEAGSIANSHRDAWFGYCMAKSALNMGSTVIHNKIRKEGGRVLLIHPGWVKSFMSGEWNPAGTYTSEEAAANILNRIEEHKDKLTALPLYIEADSGKELPW
ncbi:SDR family NAD(P)-dependent oxidoreductase [Paenibacillus sp. WC2504]|uniref:SDR family NAD(P)-dependent oxidoreductase n=1 Tax=Paenibacillus sp. WC2504 TaxID=3461403 RepID=UPI004045FD1D